MASGYILLPLSGATQPDGSGSGNNAPTWALDVSGGTPATNSPKVTTFCWDFTGAAAEQHLMWSFLLPSDAAGPLDIRLKWRMLTAITGNIVLKASSYSVADLSSDDTQAVFDPVVTSGAVAVPGTLGFTKEVSFSLNALAAAANRKTVVMVGSESTLWTAAGTLRLLAATLEYIKT